MLQQQQRYNVLQMNIVIADSYSGIKRHIFYLFNKRDTRNDRMLCALSECS